MQIFFVEFPNVIEGVGFVLALENETNAVMNCLESVQAKKIKLKKAMLLKMLLAPGSLQNVVW